MKSCKMRVLCGALVLSLGFLPQTGVTAMQVEGTEITDDNEAASSTQESIPDASALPQSESSPETSELPEGNASVSNETATVKPAASKTPDIDTSSSQKLPAVSHTPRVEEKAETDSTTATPQPSIVPDEDYTPYLSLGADLSDSQENTVLKLLGVNRKDIKDYKTVEVTNKEEHDYLGDYVSADVIGKKALSSVLVIKQEKGTGILVTTHNISYCTEGMYTNALITAGITDAVVEVAGPFEITGTAALVGAMKAYAVMTGEQISEDTMDTATNELVVTGELSDEIGDSAKTAQFMAAVKQAIVEHDLSGKDDIESAIDTVADSMGIKLSKENKEKVTNLMAKIAKLDLDVDSIKGQAQELYKKIKDLELKFDFDQGIWAKIGDFFAAIGRAIAAFFAAIGKFFAKLF